ncbi:esterase [Anaerolineae bacterium CFX9]|jgi:esterase/lipase superfamily enzyme|nr:esterase [Anaerolineae bacterium CFX9]
MNREYHRWYSPSLNRDMELLVFGHAGMRVLAFPTSMGKFYEWEDRGMVATLSEHLNNGWLQLFCVDSIDVESWYCSWAHPSGRAYRHAQYDQYLLDEVVPFSEWKNPNPFMTTVGASFGAYHAMNFGLKHPDRVRRILAMSGIYNITRFTGGYSDDNVYFNNPVDYIPNEHDSTRLSQLQSLDVIMATGREDRLIESARDLSGKLWSKGIGNALREWDGWAHDWQYWQKMLVLYIGGHD